jgi:hypothetical protein
MPKVVGGEEDVWDESCDCRKSTETYYDTDVARDVINLSEYNDCTNVITVLVAR